MFGEIGVIKYSDDKNMIQCHICGRFFKHLCSSHVPRMHSMTAYEYKKEFGLCNTYGLIGEETKGKYAEKISTLKSLGKASIYKPQGGKLTSEPLREQTKKILKERKMTFTDKFINSINEKRELAIKRYLEMKKLKESGANYNELAHIYKFKNAEIAWKQFSKLKRRYTTAPRPCTSRKT